MTYANFQTLTEFTRIWCYTIRHQVENRCENLPCLRLRVGLSHSLVHDVIFQPDQISTSEECALPLSTITHTMSFGFSVGDFIAVGKLITDISNSLRSCGGSRSEYQELLRALEALHHALHHLDKLQAPPSCTALDSIKYAALSCQVPLQQFLGKMKPYDSTLGIRARGKTLKSTIDKVWWGLGKKDEIQSLEKYLNIHIGTINILLAKHGLEKMDLAYSKAEADNMLIQEELKANRALIQNMGDSIADQAIAIQSSRSMLGDLFQMVCGELRTSWDYFGQMVTKTWYVHCILAFF